MKRNIKALIIDDDHSARCILQKYLEIAGNVDVLGSFSDTFAAHKIIESDDPDIIFLDINMPDEDGLRFANRLRSSNIDVPIVFTTAYKNYALDAFKIKPIDYLVKPFGLDDIFNVIRKAEQHLKQVNKQKSQERVWGNKIPEKLKFKVVRGYIFVSTDEILFFKAFSYYVELYLSNGNKEKITSNLSTISDELSPLNFFRINRSAIINMDYIERIDRKERKCTLKNNDHEFDFPFTISTFKQFEEIKSLKLG